LSGAVPAASGNLFDLFADRFREAGGKTAFAAPSGEPLLTYAGVLDGAARYANALENLGAAPGARVTVQAEKSIASVLLYLGCLKCGAVYQPLNTAYTLAEADYFIGDAEPHVVVCDPRDQAAMRGLADRRGVFAVLNLGAKGEGTMAALARRMETRHDTVPRAADDLAGLLYTSGTTGRSKGAMLSHGNLASNALTLHTLWAFEDGDVLLHALPFYHVHGLFVALHTAFLNTSAILWHDKFERDAVLDAIPRATVMMGVPTFYTRLLSSPRLDAALCKDMRLFICGSAPLLAETHREFEARTGHAILERYGMTETGMIASNPYDGERLAGTVGYALPDVSVRIAAQPGVIEVKGPNVFKGYWRMPEKTAEDFTADGYFITGDVGAMADDGRVSIVGRAKDLVISGGFNVYPKEVEDAIDAMDGVIESAVIGAPHPDFGEGVVAVIAAKAELPSEREIIAALAERLAKFKLPKRVFIVADLPRNSMGKVQKAELRKRYAECFTKA
jgi:malonyl-CoA/methylmalonyl-CoA synthetase